MGESGYGMSRCTHDSGSGYLTFLSGESWRCWNVGIGGNSVDMGGGTGVAEDEAAAFAARFETIYYNE